MMRALGMLLILLACPTFMMAFGLEAAGDGRTPLSILAAALMISGSLFSSAAAIARRLDTEPVDGRRRGQDEGDSVVETASDERPAGRAIRRPGFHRRAA